MHIALLSPAWPLGKYPNGIVTYVHWMREGLLREGHKVSVFTGVLDPDCRDTGIHLVREPRSRKIRMWMNERLPSHEPAVFSWGEVVAKAMLEVHRKEPIGAIEVEETFGWAQDIQRVSKIPVVMKLHGPAFLSLVGDELNADFARRKIKREGDSLAKVGKIVAPSRIILDQTLKYYALRPSMSEQVVNPIRLDDDTPLWSLDQCDRDTVLFVGRFDKRKGGDLVLQAFHKLKATRPNAKLVFVGPDVGLTDANGRSIHFEDFRVSLFPGADDGAIRYLGKLSPREISKLRTRAVVTVAASRWENQSYATLEAMLQGCPIVCSDTGGQSELIEHGVSGLLCRAEDPDDLCSQIDAVFADPQRAAGMGANARRYAMGVHDPRAVARQSVALYETLAERRPAGRPVL